jgi:hypothetical protein
MDSVCPEKAARADQAEYQLLSWQVENNLPSMEIGFRFHDSHINILISNKSFIRSPKALADFVDHVESFLENGNVHISSKIWAFSNEIVQTLLSLLHVSVRMSKAIDEKKQTLEDMGFKRYFDYEARFVDEHRVFGTLKSLNFEEEEDKRYDTHDFSPTGMVIVSTFPILRLADLSIGEIMPRLWPNQISVENKLFHCKRVRLLPIHKRERIKHERIKASNLSFIELPVTRLHAIVLDSRDRLRGHLYDWIENDGTLADYLKTKPVSLEVRQRWAAQIQKTVTDLHALGVIWGDVKADNILIDKDENAVVIDLEGGTSEGWVDFEDDDTIKGDLQGMTKLMQYLLDECLPR